jgi:hypothetical protein
MLSPLCLFLFLSQSKAKQSKAKQRKAKQSKAKQSKENLMLHAKY